MKPTQPQILAAAAAIANARGMRRGALMIGNILEILPEHLRQEVLEDAEEALKAASTVAPQTLPSGPWQTGEPPKDRTVVLIGKLVFQSDVCMGTVPVTCEAHWSEERQMWLDSDGMSIRRYVTDELVIHYWADLPKEAAASTEKGAA